MKLSRLILSSLLPLALVAAPSCAKLEKEKPVTVTTAGPHSVAVGATIELSASTAEGSDDGYAWESLDPAIAIVDASGRVTGIQPGETTIKATGQQTHVQGLHAMVVVDSVPPSDGGTSAIPFLQAWSGSPHADLTSEAFTHWSKEGEVPTTCARCHSSDGYVDYLGGDGTAPGRVDAVGTPGTGVRCSACHDAAASALTSVTFPSGQEVKGLGPEARCIVCHQGRASGADVDTQIANAGMTGEDTVSSALSFMNVHYYPAAATLFAGQAKGGYQYPGAVYDTRFRHVPSFDKCNECHDPHSTQVRWNECQTCHPGATDGVQARGIRQIASRNQDYDGDGNRDEGIYYEIDGLRGKLLQAIQRYGAERGQRICYGSSNPYWFKDTNQDGSCSAEESVSANRYAAWTPRLIKAAYNYQLSRVDPGNFAHNAKYVIQLLHDSTQAMNEGLVVKFDLSKLVREDPGHFNGASKAARNWDSSETVQESCSRCHSGAPGYRFFTQYGVGEKVPETANGLECFTCHDSFAPDYTVFIPAKTYLPDNKTVALPGKDNLCANCHIGRASKATIDTTIAAGGTLRFVNVHYLPAAGTREGTLTKIGYEYSGRTYAGRLSHMGGVQCTSCHNPAASNHTFHITDVWEQRCDTCHPDANGPEEIRLVHLQDYDGDGNTSETLEAEISGMAARLLAAMRTASGNTLCYDANTNPYFFKDTNGDGVCDANEAKSSNAFSPFTPALLKAAHNYQLSRKEPGAWAHNFNYMGQLLFDSVEDVTGATPTNMTRP